MCAKRIDQMSCSDPGLIASDVVACMTFSRRWIYCYLFDCQTVETRNLLQQLASAVTETRVADLPAADLVEAELVCEPEV